ncbi:hypothetical protein [Mycoplasmopsis columbinasalis]|uniref:Polymerase nucleotidyl transferase domain-containing protein n=1 Tax=Mycoplasmopsis columbinasalis TaxID=114880 RepID=A0A449B9G1_9BACT|nr:hypothetical protein [Mycoplasmopsis columbinasalis]VEU77806.1 Uncharacterised protein [Mycoplasmopsis columbinasalis]
MKQVNLSPKIKSILNKIESYLELFNTQHDANVKFVIKGSVANNYFSENSRPPVDVDVFFLNNYDENNIEFLKFLAEKEIRMEHSDVNLNVFLINGVKFEIIMLEHFTSDEFFHKTTKYKWLLFLKPNFSLIQKLFSISYIDSNFFMHNKNAKIKSFCFDVNEFLKKNDILTVFLMKLKENSLNSHY